MRGRDEGPFSRQSFLGEGAQDKIERTIVGICGLGGGGSQVAQQLAHIGFINLVLFDRDVVELSNLNRLVGATQGDVDAATPKVEVLRRLILGVRPSANVAIVRDYWQSDVNRLKQCDLVFGCVDGLDQRSQLEGACRSHLIPLIDVGMDVQRLPDGSHSVSGQVILSMPGHACMRCMGFLDDNDQKRAGAAYGDAGANPQVIWTNGLLASSAVGLAVDLVTDWSNSLRDSVYLSHRGAAMTLEPDRIAECAPTSCPHFPMSAAGPARFRAL